MMSVIRLRRDMSVRGGPGEGGKGLELTWDGVKNLKLSNFHIHEMSDIVTHF